MAAILSTHAAKDRQRNDKREKLSDRVLVVSQVLLFACGVAAPVAGLLLAAIHAAFPAIPEIDVAATILCILTIPLLLLGSHLMDVIDRRRMRRRETPSIEKPQLYDNN